MKGDIHNSSGTICRAEKRPCPLGADGHSKNIEDFIEVNAAKHGYDADTMRRYASEGMKPKEILILAKENSRTVATLNGEKSVVKKLREAGSTVGFTDDQVRAAWRKNSKELTELRETSEALLAPYDRAREIRNKDTTSTFIALEKKQREIQEQLRKSLIENGVSRNYASYFAASKLAPLGMAKDYVGLNRKTGKAFTISEGELTQLSKGAFSSRDPKVIAGVEAFFSKNNRLINETNKLVTERKNDIREQKEAMRIVAEEGSKHRGLIERREELLNDRANLNRDLLDRKAAREAGITDGPLTFSRDASKVVADENGEFKNLFVKNERGEYRRIVGYDPGTYLGNNSALLDSSGNRYSTVGDSRFSTMARPNVTYIIDDSVQGAPIGIKDFTTPYSSD